MGQYREKIINICEKGNIYLGFKGLKARGLECDEDNKTNKLWGVSIIRGWY